MIIANRFKNDNNELLKLVQHDLYWTLLSFLFTYMRDGYLRAVRLIGIDTDLSKKISEIYSYDHRVLQDPHDKIAAYYRYQYPDKEGQYVFPFIVPDCSDLSPEKVLQVKYKMEWSSFWHKEVKELINEPIIARTILKAIAYENSNDGYEAEDLLLELLHDRYGKSWDSIDSLAPVQEGKQNSE